MLKQYINTSIQTALERKQVSVFIFLGDQKRVKILMKCSFLSDFLGSAVLSAVKTGQHPNSRPSSTSSRDEAAANFKISVEGSWVNEQSHVTCHACSLVSHVLKDRLWSIDWTIMHITFIMVVMPKWQMNILTIWNIDWFQVCRDTLDTKKRSCECNHAFDCNSCIACMFIETATNDVKLNMDRIVG